MSVSSSPQPASGTAKLGANLVLLAGIGLVGAYIFARFRS